MPFEGDSGVLKTVAGSAPQSLQQYTNQAPGEGKCRTFSIYCPDGTDPGIAANTDTVYVGPNKSAAFPIAPGGWKDFEDVDPALVSFMCATANQLVFFAFGGSYV